MRSLVKYLVVVLMAFGVTNAALADGAEVGNAHVTMIATTQLYLQNAVIFQIDKGITSYCNANSWVYYYGVNADDRKIVYATVLAAYLSGRPVIVDFPNANNSCIADGVLIGAHQ